MTSNYASNNFTLPDGATLAYDIFGSEHLGKHKVPLILIGGVSNRKIDWEPLTGPLCTRRPVLVFDHRGIGDSTYSTPARNDEVTIEVMARDLLALIKHLGWKDVDILGFSMGGVVLQQLLIFHDEPSQSTPLPFRIHHALLTGTLCHSPINTQIPQFTPAYVTPGKRLTVAQRKELVRPTLDASLGPDWVSCPKNRERYEWWLERMIHGRPQRTILKQRAALTAFDFRQHLQRLSPSTKILVIHGHQDLIVPFSAGKQVLESIPHALPIQVGFDRGQVPSLEFGHIWYEYFDVNVWTGVIEAFVDDENVSNEKARL